MPDYFTLAEARDLPDMDRFSDAQIEAAAAYIVGVIEREVGTSFIARTRTETLDGGWWFLSLSDPYPQAVSSILVGGVAVNTALTPVDFRGGILRYTAGTYWTTGVANVVVTYTAGYSTLATMPADVKQAALQGTRARLLDTSSNATLNDRRQSITNDVGGTTSFVLAGPDRPTGYPEVDAVILAWRDKIRVPSVA